MELLGMAIGSLVLGNVADRIGRRPTILGCLVLMAISMYMASTATGVVDLSLCACSRALHRRRARGDQRGGRGVLEREEPQLQYSLMAMGYPLGAVFGGLVAAELLKSGDWRPVFHFGAVVTAACIPLVWFFVPESVSGWRRSSRPVR
jgi:MFS family permease